MKILRISLRNIASLAGEHTVDFTSAPLANAGLFSISGPTGSGKSTLLDALCLALYDKTPRMDVAEGTQAVEDAGAEIQQNDVRNLLRRGCGTGLAEVAFVGVDGEIYTARWEVRRARERAEGKLQKTQHSLLKGNVPPGREGIVAGDGTPSVVKQKIAAKVGLSFDQFRRAVLLAQGDFATFLKARDTERAEILQALTGTERFEKISKAVFLRNKQEQDLVQELRNQIGASLPLSPEAREEVDQALRQAVALQKGIERELAGRNKQLEWFEVEAGHRQRLGEATREVARLDALVQANAPRARTLGWIRTASHEAGPKRTAEKQSQSVLAEAVARESELRQHDATLLAAVETAEACHKVAKKALEDVLERQRGIDAELAKARVLDGELVQIDRAAALAQREYASATDALTNAEAALSALNLQLGGLAKKKQQLQQRLAQVASVAPFARDLEVWLERFKTEGKVRLKNSQLEKRVRDAETQTARASGQLEKTSGQLPGLRQKCAQAEAAWKQAAETAASFHAEEILAGRRNAIELQSTLQKSQAHIAEQQRLEGERQDCVGSLNASQEQLAKENLRRTDLSEKLLPDALSTLNQARESLRLAEAAASEHAAILRDTLVQGEACPVCGSLEHPNAGAEASAQNAVLRALRNSTEQREKALRDLQKELAAVEARIEEKNGQHQKLTRDLARLEKQLAEAQGYTPGLAEVADLFRKPAPQRDVGLQRLEAQTTDLLRALDKTDVERSAAEKLQNALRAEFAKAESDLLAAEKAETEAQNVCAAARTEHTNALSEWDTIRAEHAIALDAVSPVVSALSRSGAERDYAENPEAFRDWFSASAREYNAAVQLHDAAVQEEAVKLPQLGTMETAAAAAREVLAKRTTDMDAVRRGLSERQTERAALLGGRSVETAEFETAAEVESARGKETESAAGGVAAQNKLSTHRGLLQDQQKRIATAESAARKEADAMDAWIKEFSAREGLALDRTQLDGWLGRDAQWINREQQELGGTAQALAAARGIEEERRRYLEEHVGAKTTEDNHDTVKAEADRLSGEAKAAGEAVDARRAVVLGDDDRRRTTGELSQKLEAQEKQWDPWQKLNALVGSLDGTKFRNIAQQWTLEVLLRHANAQLALLSGRYRLERLRDSLNLLVTDLEMDGQQRSVHSLSGGESFLVSLGLALGLASLTSSRLLIESLFIDEGFGSLDSETLRVALNALNHLESQGRKVGVISHVSEMVDAIPVQVRVVRGPGGASRIVV
jgi:DNA repair protein SbcC/Rad50